VSENGETRMGNAGESLSSLVLGGEAFLGGVRRGQGVLGLEKYTSDGRFAREKPEKLQEGKKER